VTEREYTEPNNEQLANFLSVMSPHIAGLEHLNLKPEPAILEMFLERNPTFRANGLRLHREFQEQIHEHTEKMEKGGELQCEHIRPNGKKCPNRNEAGSLYCGLHKSEGE
jgi:hypothetical protein